MWAQRAWRVGLPSGMGRSKLENAAGVGQVCSQRIIKRTGGSGPPNKGACHALLAPALSGSSPLSRELAGLVRQRLRSHYLPTVFFFLGCLFAQAPPLGVHVPSLAGSRHSRSKGHNTAGGGHCAKHAGYRAASRASRRRRLGLLEAALAAPWRWRRWRLGPWRLGPWRRGLRCSSSIGLGRASPILRCVVLLVSPAPGTVALGFVAPWLVPPASTALHRWGVPEQRAGFAEHVRWHERVACPIARTAFRIPVHLRQ